MSDYRWKQDGPVSFAYVGNALVGVVRDWSAFRLGDPQKPWQAGRKEDRDDNLVFESFGSEAEAKAYVERCEK